jgi:hypothetical protein
MRFLLLLFCLVSPCLRVLGEEAKSAPQDLRVRMWIIPPDYYCCRNPGISSAPQEKPGPASTQSDIRPWLEAHGIKFAPGEEAIYDVSVGVLLVRAKAETLDAIDALGLQVWAREPIRDLHAEMDLVEFPASAVPDLHGEIPFETLRKAAGDSWLVLNRMQTVTKSGQRVSVISKAGTPEEKPPAPPIGKDQPQPSDGPPPPPLLRGELGSTLEFEPVLGPDGIMIDVNLIYHFRAPGPPAWDWESNISMTVKNGVPVVLQLSSAPADGDPSRPAKLRAIVLRVDVVYPEKLVNPFAKESRAPAALANPKP